jgi:hypothetical protein
MSQLELKFENVTNIKVVQEDVSKVKHAEVIKIEGKIFVSLPKVNELLDSKI